MTKPCISAGAGSGCCPYPHCDIDGAGKSGDIFNIRIGTSAASAARYIAVVCGTRSTATDGLNLIVIRPVTGKSELARPGRRDKSLAQSIAPIGKRDVTDGASVACNRIHDLRQRQSEAAHGKNRDEGGG